MLSKKRLLNLTFAVILSICVLAIVRLLPRTEVDARFANLFEKPEPLPEGLLSVQPEPASSGPCIAWEHDDQAPSVCSLTVCWEVDTLPGSKGSALGYNFVELLNGKSIESLDPNQIKYAEAIREGTGNPNGPDHCPPGNEDWSLAAGAIEIDQKTLIGTGRDVRIEFLGVPVFYTPWISFPVGDQRKSGLLFPTIGSGSRTGTQIAVPYYWNLAENYDATLTTRWYSSRGIRLDPELRYLSDRSRSQLNVEYLVNDQETGEARGVIDWRHVTRFAPRTRLLIDATDVSDNDYFQDFGVGFEGTSVQFVNRYIDLRHDTAAWTLNARAQGYQVHLWWTSVHHQYWSS